MSKSAMMNSNNLCAQLLVTWAAKQWGGWQANMIVIVICTGRSLGTVAATDYVQVSYVAVWRGACWIADGISSEIMYRYTESKEYKSK